MDRVTAAGGRSCCPPEIVRVAYPLIAGTPGEFAWGGAAGTAFWIDPGEQMIVVFMTQIMQMGLPSPYPLRRELRTLTSASVIE
jgi:CubicO group peptidase (beta-lactamase class C family)